MALRIAVLDRQLTMADSIATRLDEQADVESASPHTSAEELLAVVTTSCVDVVLVDWRLCDTDPSPLDRLRELAPDIKVVVIGYEARPSDLRDAVRAGVAGWLPPDSSVEELLACVRTAHEGGFWIPRRVILSALTAVEAVDGPALLQPLTLREREVLQGMVDGLPRGEIADRLNMSPHTVRTHVQSLLRKLGVHSSLQAVALARQAGLTTGSEELPHQRAGHEMDNPGVRTPNLRHRP